jgi:hypothetical protein
MKRRRFLAATGAAVLGGPSSAGSGRATETGAPVTLLTAPIELGGAWGGSPPAAAGRVIERAREVMLSGVRLLSDRQPDRLRIDDHASGPPFVWLHSDPPREAWMIVDIGARDWSKLAYQFGHELGHVLCNSWRPNAKPHLPCQWLEESMAEAFSIRGLGLLAASWVQNPLYAGTGAFGQAIRDYRAKIIEGYRRPGEAATGADIALWFAGMRATLARTNGLDRSEGPAILAILALLERDKGCVADMGAVNRWPGRSALPLAAYLAAWTASCTEIGAPGRLPLQIRSCFGIDAPPPQTPP